MASIGVSVSIDWAKHVKSLIEMSAETGVTAAAAMQYSQAAVNAANAMRALGEVCFHSREEELRDLQKRLAALQGKVSAPERPGFVPEADPRNVSSL